MRNRARTEKLPLTKQVLRGDLDSVQRLLKSGASPNERDEQRRSPLMHAAIDGNTELVRILAEHGAELDGQDEDGLTALHFAARGYSRDVATELLRRGASVDVQDRFGNTPLSDAVFGSRGRGELIRLLLANGADKGRANHQGVSPLKLAESIANYDLKPFLE